MEQAQYRPHGSVWGSVFGVYVRCQTYVNVIYLLLAFTLGIAYFVFLVAGLGLGFGLIITWFGIPILLPVLLASWALSVFEREMAIRLLGEHIPPILRDDLSDRSLWTRLKALLTNPVTWTRIVYLFAKFPIGIASFVVTVVLLSVTFALISAPLHYWATEINVGSWEVDTLGEAFALLTIGVLVGLIAPHILNLAAFISGRFAYLMLGARWWES